MAGDAAEEVADHSKLYAFKHKNVLEHHKHVSVHLCVHLPVGKAHG